MLKRENGQLVHERYMVVPRATTPVPELDGKVFRFRYGWQLTSEVGGIYAGEAAMVPVRFDPDFPWPTDAPPWLASGDVRRMDEAEEPQLPEGAA
jgi:hypothetical protein